MKRGHDIFEFGEFRLDAAECTLFRNRRAVRLEPQVFKTLLVLVANAGRLVEKERFFDEVWCGAAVEEGNLTRNISLLRKSLGESLRGERYIETVPKRGYRFVAPVRNMRDERAASQAATEARQLMTPDEEAETGGRLARFGWIILAGAVIASLLLVSAVIRWSRDKDVEPSGSGAKVSVAVLPFKAMNEHDRDEALEISMTQALIDKLSSVPELVVRPMGVVRSYGASDQDPLEAGRQLGVDAVVDSTMQRGVNEIRISMRLLRVRDGKPFWHFQSNERQPQMVELQNLLSEKVVSSLLPERSARQNRFVTPDPTRNAEAYQLYLRGRYLFDRMTPDSVKASTAYFQKAIDKDPEFAQAYAGLAASYTLFGHLRVLRPKEVYPAAKAALARAMELDESLSEAHAQQGFVSLHYDYEWARAGKEFQRAIELNPNNSMAYHGRAFYLAALNRIDEAVVEINRAVELEPVSLNLNADRGLLLFYAGRDEEGIAQLQETLAMERDYPLAILYLARIYGRQQRERQAFDHYSRWAELTGHWTGSDKELSVRAFAGSGINGYYRFELDRLKNLLAKRYVPPFDFARLYAALGDNDQTMEWLEKAYEDRNFAIPLLTVEPGFNRVRSDPRFSDFMRKVGLP